MTSYALINGDSGAPARAAAPLFRKILARIERHQERKRSGALHRTGRPVRGGSLEAGTFEDTFFRAPGKGEPDRQLKALKLAVDEGKKLAREARRRGEPLLGQDQLLAQLTDLTARVYEVFVTLSRVCKGEVYPSYDQIAKKSGRGRASVARAIKLLEALGFLVKVRRFKKVEGEGPGPRYEQTSNAYRLSLPEFAAKLFPTRRAPAPKPDDVVWHEIDRVETVAHMLATLPAKEFAAQATSPDLRDAFRMRDALDLREALQSLGRTIERKNLA